MAGVGCFERDFRGLFISDLADQHHVRVLPEQGSQNNGKCSVHGLVDLGLVHEIENLLDWVFDGNEIDVRTRIPDLLKDGINRCRLAAAGWPGDQNDPAWLIAEAGCEYSGSRDLDQVGDRRKCVAE